MAKVEKPAEPKESLKKSILSEIRQWLEDKIKSARKWAKPRATRVAKRYGGPVGIGLIILLISLSLFLPKDQFQKAKENLVQNPRSLESYLALIEEYLRNNQVNEAEKQLLLAEQIQPSDYQVHQLWQKKKELSPEDIKELIKYWEKVVAEKPDYRDGYFQLALLYYKLYNNEKAKEYLEQSLILDPNFEPAKELKEVLGN
jgi:tetratricopeptide (TPR) repeat protein